MGIGGLRSRWLAAAVVSLGTIVAVPIAGGNLAGATGGSTTTTWLCRPGMADNPCVADLTTTVVEAGGSHRVQWAAATVDPPIDCFYVYPTVSEQTTVNANLEIQPPEIAQARSQASRFSQDCKVYAPMYPQLTDIAIAHATEITTTEVQVAYGGVLSAWKDYLANDNDGRGVVLIGHSQGAAMLIDLIKNEIDPYPAVRRLLVSAIILGGNVTVPIGKEVGGSFQNVPACTSSHQTGCVVAYSTFDQVPPANTLFGKPGTGVSELTGTTATDGVKVLCVNPASLAGGSGVLQPYFPSLKIVAPLGTQQVGVPHRRRGPPTPTSTRRTATTRRGSAGCRWTTSPNRVTGARCSARPAGPNGGSTPKT